MKTRLWQANIAVESWAAYAGVIDALTEAEIPFALAGGHAISCYTGRARTSKDLDLIILPESREAIIELVTSRGWEDYYDRLPYDRNWIYRAWLDGTILDFIWAMPNQRASVDAKWILDGPYVRLKDRRVRLIPAEELVWAKIYVMQFDRCDWPDLFNLLFAVGEKLDWRHLLDRLQDDVALLSSLLVVFSWLRPECARLFPQWLWHELHLPKPAEWPVPALKREALLDTRDWFPAAAGGELSEAV